MYGVTRQDTIELQGHYCAGRFTVLMPLYAMYKCVCEQVCCWYLEILVEGSVEQDFARAIAHDHALLLRIGILGHAEGTCREDSSHKTSYTYRRHDTARSMPILVKERTKRNHKNHETHLTKPV